MHQEDLLLLLAHETKDIFSRLGGYLYLFKQNMVTKEESDMLLKLFEEELYDNESYLTDLLSWAREKQTNKDNTNSSFSLHTTIALILDAPDIKNEISHKKIHIQKEIPNVLLSIDRTLYTVALKNILKNAIKYSEPLGNIYITAQLANNTIVTHVKDKGIGLQAGDKEAETDTAVIPTSYKPKAGSGMGLSLCKSFLQLAGGKIWAKNNPDKGASFFFSLPFQ